MEGDINGETPNESFLVVLPLMRARNIKQLKFDSAITSKHCDLWRWLVGVIGDLHFESWDHGSYVSGADLSSLGRIQKLPHNMERAGVAENV